MNERMFDEATRTLEDANIAWDCHFILKEQGKNYLAGRQKRDAERLEYKAHMQLLEAENSPPQTTEQYNMTEVTFTITHDPENLELSESLFDDDLNPFFNREFEGMYLSNAVAGRFYNESRKNHGQTSITLAEAAFFQSKDNDLNKKNPLNVVGAILLHAYYTTCEANDKFHFILGDYEERGLGECESAGYGTNDTHAIKELIHQALVILADVGKNIREHEEAE